MWYEKVPIADVIANDPVIELLADFRTDHGRVLIVCPFSLPGEPGHHCIVTNARPGRAGGIICAHPRCRAFTTDDFVDWLGFRSVEY
jgi:hypothetical protein